MYGLTTENLLVLNTVKTLATEKIHIVDRNSFCIALIEEITKSDQIHL